MAYGVWQDRTVLDDHQPFITDDFNACTLPRPSSLSFHGGPSGYPHCARHHPLHGTQQRVPGTPSTSFSNGRAAGLAFTARVITRCVLKSNRYPALHPPRPGTINPVCATREHRGTPTVLLTDRIRPSQCHTSRRSSRRPRSCSHATYGRTPPCG